ncbi:tyrosine-type recombinase/integrase [Alkalibacillus sp. S2W]|uniref:tyrosine-type recombinase/integrase n=1 Tax=Alkalibacillus sp. S2W TaxID=3386553 RepID=UPI00398C8F3C
MFSEGSIYKPNCKCNGKCRCNATWYYHFNESTFDPVKGDYPQYKKGGFKTKKEAYNAKENLKQQLLEEKNLNRNITFSELADKWFKHYKYSNDVKMSTIRIRGKELNILKNYLENVKVSNINSKMFQSILDKLIYEQNYAFNTIAGVNTTATMIFKYAYHEDFISVIPNENTRIPKKRKTVEELKDHIDVPNYMEKQELKQFLSTAKEIGLEHDYQIFLLLSYTGMRSSELQALTWGDIFFDNNTIRVFKQIYNPNNNKKKYDIVTTKNDIARIIDVDHKVMEEFQRFKSFKESVSNYVGPNDFIFTNELDNPYTFVSKRIGDRMDRVTKHIQENINQNFTRLTPHALRHTHISLLAEAEVPLEHIMDRVGHQDSQTTKKIYLHVTQSGKDKSAQKFSELMANL